MSLQKRLLKARRRLKALKKTNQSYKSAFNDEIDGHLRAVYDMIIGMEGSIRLQRGY
jgi:hypothetical protein